MLEVEERTGVTVVRLCHGKVSALDVELLRELTATLQDLDPATAVVLTGTGSVFSAGVDLRRIVDGGAAYVEEFLPALSETFLAVFDHPGPVVAAINGHAIAGGCVIAAACDVRLMASGSIGLAELSVGVPFPTSAMEIMRHAVGPAAGRLVLTAELLDVAAAQAIGLVQAVSGEVLAAALAQASRMGQVPAEAFAFSKRQLHQPVWERIAAHAAAADAVQKIWTSPSTHTAITAYMNNLRRPN